METNSLDYITVRSTQNELIKVGKTETANALSVILKCNALPKPEEHNRKYEIATTYYKIDLSTAHLEEIIDLFSNLEVSSLSENGESTHLTDCYVSLLDKWLEIKAYFDNEK